MTKQILADWYCRKCEKEFTSYDDGFLKPYCPNCKNETDFDQIHHLETLQIG